MKKLVTLCIVALLAFGMNAQKFAHVNSQQILEQMPEKVTAENELKRYSEQKEKELQQMMAFYQKMVEEFTRDEPTLTESLKQARVKEIQEKEVSIQNFRQTAEQRITEKQQTLLTPIIEKVKVAIKSVGTKNGYTYIFDVSAGALVFFDGGTDVSDLVKKELAAN